jgi:glucose-6-phosphate 1-dehydrogenase
MSSTVIAIFGAQGDLAKRKLFPSLYQLEKAGLLDDELKILALGRNINEDFIEQTIAHITKYVPQDELDCTVLDAFIAKLEVEQLDFAEPSQYFKLKEKLSPPDGLAILYYATAASLYDLISENLAEAGCLHDGARVVVEKPIGYDLSSSQEINNQLARYFKESQIYRIDHYLGKETVQNLIALRFANPLFETQWNLNHISHVEITVAEHVGIEGRWGYFDKAGQLRDMVQNHLLQLLCLVAMDPPSDLSADSIRNEKVKVLKSLKTITPEMMGTHLVRGRYTSGICDGQPVPGYLEEEGANQSSDTETFVAIKAEVDSWRWAGVPFYLRTGKRMPDKMSQIIIHFKAAPHYIFDPDQKHLINNRLIIRLQPDEGISLQVMTKAQGLDKGMRLRSDPLKLSFSQNSTSERIPDAYERLLLEVLKGNQYLFVRRDEVEYAWKWCDQLVSGWNKHAQPPKKYPAGTSGPASSIALITRDDRFWSEDV